MSTEFLLTSNKQGSEAPALAETRLNGSDLVKAIKGCDAIHITLSQLDEYSAVKRIVDTAKNNGNIKLISFVSGATVCEENRSQLALIDAKYRSEQYS